MFLSIKYNILTPCIRVVNYINEKGAIFLSLLSFIGKNEGIMHLQVDQILQ